MKILAENLSEIIRPHLVYNNQHHQFRAAPANPGSASVGTRAPINPATTKIAAESTRQAAIVRVFCFIIGESSTQGPGFTARPVWHWVLLSSFGSGFAIHVLHPTQIPEIPNRVLG